MRRLVSSATPGCPLMARLAVATETPTALATSRMPTGLPGASPSLVMGSSAGGVREGPPGINLHDATRHGKSAQRTRVWRRGARHVRAPHQGSRRGARPAPGRHVPEISHTQKLYRYMVLPYSRVIG